MGHLFVVDSLDKHIQNEKESILASAGVFAEKIFLLSFFFLYMSHDTYF